MSLITYSINIDSDLYNRITPEYEAGNYSSAIKTAILFLTEEIRERTDLDIDGDSLITKAFSERNPLIKINTLETETDRSEQTGYMLMLQGLYKAIRNPRNHNLKEDTKETCDDLLVIINYFLKLIKKSKTKFDFIEFETMIKDTLFVCTTEYSSELIKLIPEEKYLEVVQKLLENIDSIPTNNLAWIIYAIKIVLENDKRSSLINLLDNSLLRTKNTSMMRASALILQENWKELSIATKLRIEKVFFDSFTNIEYLWENDTDRYGNYVNFSYLNEAGVTASYIRYIPYNKTETLGFMFMKPIIENVLKKGDDYIEFVFDNFGQYLFRENNYINEGFNDVIISLITNKSSKMYKLLTSGYFSNDEFTSVYDFSDDIQSALDMVK